MHDGLVVSETAGLFILCERVTRNVGVFLGYGLFEQIHTQPQKTEHPRARVRSNKSTTQRVSSQEPIDDNDQEAKDQRVEESSNKK